MYSIMICDSIQKGVTMKKLLRILILAFIFILVACDRVDGEISVIFEQKPTVTLMQYDEPIDFKEGLVVKDSKGNDLTDLVIVDLSQFSTEYPGATVVYYRLNYLGKDYESYIVVNVNPFVVEYETYYSVTFIVNGGNSIPTQFILEGKTLVELPTPVREGYEFVGWYKDSDFEELFDIEDIIESDLKLYAKWEFIVVETPDPTTLNIYYLNDLHGRILPDGSSMGIANIANLILDAKDQDPEHTIFLAGGDMLQGHVISNYYTGASVIDILNHMDLDAYVVGNHEFDWGIDQVLQYFDGTNELQAQYPILGANVYYKDSNTRVETFEPYTIIEKAGIKVAVIGLIGYGLESSILATRVEDYKFVEPVSLTAYYAEMARTQDGADVVIAINHDGPNYDGSNDYYNREVAKLTGNQKVDLIFNGHTHSAYINFYPNYGRTVPVLQSGSYAQNVGYVKLNINPETDSIDLDTVMNLNKGNTPKLNQTHTVIKELLDMYEEGVHDLLYRVYMKSGSYISKSELTLYIAKLMMLKFGADVGVQNSGGTRSDISANEDITYGKLYEILPFDNTVMLSKIKGSVLKSSYRSNEYVLREGLTLQNIQDNTYYMVATNNYVFYDTGSVFKNGIDIVATYYNMLDIFIEVVEWLADHGYTSFSTSLPIVFDNDVYIFVEAIIPTTKSYQV